MSNKKVMPEETSSGNQKSYKIDSLNNNHSLISKIDDESFIKGKEQPLLDAHEGATRSPAPKEVFMSPFTAFSTIINIVLATGPFTYLFFEKFICNAFSIPKPFNDSGIILGSLFLVIILIFAFITADFLVEALAISNALE